MISREPVTNVACPFCKKHSISVMDGAFDQHGRKGVYAMCQIHTCSACGPTVFFFNRELVDSDYELAVNEAFSREDAISKAVALWNHCFAPDLTNINAAWKFYLAVAKDSSAGATGAFKDAQEWLTQAVNDLLEQRPIRVAEDWEKFAEEIHGKMTDALGFPKQMSDNMKLDNLDQALFMGIFNLNLDHRDGKTRVAKTFSLVLKYLNAKKIRPEIFFDQYPEIEQCLISVLNSAEESEEHVNSMMLASLKAFYNQVHNYGSITLDQFVEAGQNGTKLI
ncbi:hypothetical protein [Ewingella americana]|uniref:Uncharacterized protein n=1 Tax=Ewingella americana TaxID=41202 RepID=A0A502GDR4_9GAMM|nr:hypothetical protein [Ewingella americana]TPG59891.1 hypothetical protein EAH77_15100 [Ewingella americana]